MDAVLPREDAYNLIGGTLKWQDILVRFADYAAAKVRSFSERVTDATPENALLTSEKLFPVSTDRAVKRSPTTVYSSEQNRRQRDSMAY